MSYGENMIVKLRGVHIDAQELLAWLLPFDDTKTAIPFTVLARELPRFAVKSDPQWIPVTERLPEDSTTERGMNVDCQYCKADCVHRGEQREKECRGYVPMTNADRIRAMRDEELLKFIGHNSLCDQIQNESDWCEKQATCENCLEKWLKQPAEE